MNVKKLLALLLALVMVVSLAACSSSSTEETQAAETQAAAAAEETTAVTEEVAETVEPVTLNVGFMSNYASLWAVLSGINNGYFAEEGITVNLIQFEDGPSEIAAMEGGSLDLAYIGKGAHRLCVLGSAVIFAPSSVHTTDTMVVTAASGITADNWKETLAGKTIAYNAGSSSETAMDTALSAAGLERGDITPNALDINYIASAMASGSVDAAFTWNPYTDQILQNVEGTTQIEVESGSTNMSSWICLPDYYEANRDVLVRYARALLKAMSYGADSENWEQIAQWCATQTATDYDANYSQTGDATWFSAEDVAADLADGTLVAYYEGVMNDFLASGSITADQVSDVSNWVLLDVLQEAIDTMS